MRSSKDRKHVKKRTHKALAASKTEESRQRRLDNKAKRDEIHAIDPDAKVKIIDQKTFIDVGYLNEVEVIDNKIKTVYNLQLPQEAFKHTEAVIEKIETKNKNTLQRLTDKFIRK